LPHKSEKTTGCNLFAGLPYRLFTLQAKICYAPFHFTGPSVFLIFPEAYLLTEKKKKI